MNTLLDPLAPVLHAVLANAAKASLLACAVALICLLLRRWLSPGWRHILWCTVFLRLMLPDLAVPGWRWNVNHLVPDVFVASKAEQSVAARNPESLTPDAKPLPTAAPLIAMGTELPGGTPSVIATKSPPPIASTREPLHLWQVLALIWLAGTVVWWAALGAAWWRFKRRVLDTSTEATPQARALLAACMTEAGVRARVHLRCSEKISAPSVCGVFHHIILLPRSLEPAISTAELRLLLLHELGHVKRRDSLVQVLASLLLGLHWWNPFLWMAWRQLRHEGEAATDAWVLQRTGANSAPPYGAMLLTLASRACAASLTLLLVPSLIGATSQGRRLKRRIQDIAAHRFTGRWAVVPGLVVLACLVMAGFSQEAAKKDPPAKPAAASADIIGGIVVDEEGQPIAGAEVEIEVKPTQSKYIKSILPVDYKAPAPVNTDAEGRWQFSGVPVGVVPASTLVGQDAFYIHVTHPQYLYRGFASDSSGDDASFRQRTVKLVLKRGLAMSGVVRDESGQAIAGATIENSPTIGLRGTSKVTADASGRYEMKSVRSGDLTVRVSARGFATQLQRYKVRVESGQDFTLKKAQKLMLKIRDDKDQPAAGASVAIFPPGDSWKATDRLLSIKESPMDGVIVWEEAPAGELVAEITGRGFARITRKVSAGDEVLIKIPAENRLATVTLKVTAAATGAALPDCTFDTGLLYSTASDRPIWMPIGQTAVPIKPSAADGEYKGTILESHQKYGLRFCIRHEGYVPQLTARMNPAQGDSTLSVALEKGQPLEITVRDFKDATVAGASVFVVWQSTLQLVGFSPGPLAASQMEFIGATGADGRCILPPCAADASVLVTHESGFAAVAFADAMRSPTMRLGLYAQVEAIVKKDGKPAPGEKYDFRGAMDLPGGLSYSLNVSQSFAVVSDAEGRISLPRVLPTRIGRFNESVPPVPSGQRTSSSTFSVPGKGVQKVPVGQTTVFELVVEPSQARTLTGRFVIQGSGAPAASRIAPISLHLNRPPVASRTVFAAGMCLVDNEGRFTFERIAPGDYSLEIQSSAARPARYALPGGQTSLKVTLPVPTADTAGKPFDLGDIEVVDTQK